MELLTQILLVSQERSARTLPSLSSENDWRLETVTSAWDALERVRSAAGPDLVILDLAQKSEGLHPLRWLRRVCPNLPVLVIADFDDPNQKLEALRSGAQDYLVRPMTSQQFEASIQRALHHVESAESEVVADEIEQFGEEMFFVAASPTMRKLRAQAELLAQVNGPVFIVGEQGSGKELAARMIHKMSLRGGFRFLKLDCSTLPGDALESELFGMADGNGRIKPGRLELCHCGTLLLDEITEMPLSLQTKLVRVLQEGHFIRQGSERRVEVDVRILAASRMNIQQALAGHKLREDLYYRLSSFTVHVPALRQRKEEIPLLLSHFMNQLSKRYGLPARIFSSASLQACQQHSWPGNLSELEKFVKRYLVMGDGGPGMESHSRESEMTFWNAYLPSNAGQRNWDRRGSDHGEATMQESSMGGVAGGKSGGLKSLVQSVKGEAERNAIAGALEQAGWNRKAAARLLKVSYRTLLYKIEQYRMSPPAGQLPAYSNGRVFRERELSKGIDTSRSWHPGKSS